ncbi:beta strand repeat-containing protein, partial [Pseudorhizobium flavum]|uniref:beta strand repeat-containing protein n=1 Tax=Pseudorhizobium flavum TaxID=1335061 RepID=UPI0037704D7A
ADGLSAVATGALNIRWGADDADTVADLGGLGDRSIAFTNATVSVANAYNGASLTSLGLPVSTAVLANGTLVGYTGSTVPTSSAAANVVFHATLSDNGSGSYTFTLVKPLDHAAGDGANGENDLSLSFGYTATDSDGDTVTGRFTVDVRDDVATIGAPFAGGIVEEEQKQVAGDGNEGTEGEGDADSFGGFLGLQFRDRTTHETGGSLSISWGSDDANDGNGQPGDRSVQFGPDAVANLTALNLTSDGDAIKYTTVTVSGQQVLLAYTGNVIPTTVPTTTNAALAGNIVFSVALSDTGAGSYAFKLYDTLDHQGSVQGEDSQILNFQFTATDSDGDVTAPATFSVKVIDDQPIALGTILDRVVEEEELSNGNEDRVSGSGDLDADTSIFGLPLNLATDKADGSLNIAWGGDDGNKNVNGGFTGTQVAGDRSVVFSTGTGAAKILTANEVSQFLTVSGGNGPVAIGALTSEGKPLVFTLSANGSILTASADGKTVFTVKLSDQGNGSFDFDLDGVLDHPVKASGAANEDVLSFKFTFTARDGDGDIARNDFTVKVIDDAPVRGEEVRGTAEDEAVNGGNNEADGLSAVATGALNIRWGADDADTVADLGGLGDRSIAFTNATVSVANAYNGASLTSLGLPVSTAVLANGTLVGYTGSTVPTSSAAANVVFHATLSDNGSGSYTFTLVKPLDHAAGDGANGENDLSLSFGYTATDSDGDTVTGRFTVDVRDDVATIGAPFAGGIVEEEQKQVAGDGNEGTEGEGDADSFGGFLGLQFRDRTTHETGGSLSISWGSDDANDGNGQPGDRSVQFGPDAVANLTALNLTSDGDAIKYTTVTVSGQQVLLAYTGNVIPTTVPTTTNAALAGNIVFSVALSDTGAGSYAFKLYDTLDHQGSVQGEDSQILNFQFTATDSDGDVTAPATFSVKVIDDQPIALGTILDRVVEEEELSNGNEDRVSGSGDLDADTSIFGLPLNLATDKADGSLNIAWGGDDGNKNVNGGFTGTQVAGDRSVVFSTGTGAAKILTANEVSQFLTVSGGNGPVAIGALTSEGKPLVFTLSANGSILTASADGKTVFTVKLSDQGNGSFDFDLDGVLDHPVKASGAANEDVLSFKFTFTARDGDGDIARNDFTVKVIDDAPTVEDNAVVQLDDDSLVVGATPIVATGVLENELGADGGKVSWLSNGMTLGNNGLWYQYVSPTELIITQNQNGQTVQVVKMTITNQATGAYSIEQLAPVRHPVGGVEDNIEFTVSYEARDGDNDTAAGTITVKINDDMPTVEANAVVQLDDDSLVVGATPIVATGVLENELGADGGKVSWLSNGMTLGNNDLWYQYVSPTELIITQNQNGQTVQVVKMTITNQVTGAYSIEQLAPVRHPLGGVEDNIEFTVSYEARDGDNDTATGTITVNINDDTPTGGAGTTAWLNDDILSSGNPGGNGDHGLANTSNVLKHSFGADGPGGIAWSGITVTNGGNQADFASSVSTDGKTLQVFQSGTLVITAVLNPLTGQYTLTQNAPIDHVTGGNENEIQFKFNYNVTDGDGDVAPGYIWVNVDDDTPTGGAGTTAWLNDDILSSGNPGGNGDHGLANTSNVLKHSFGADGPGGIAWSGITVTNGGNQADFASSVSTDGKTLQVFQSGTLVITAVLNPLTGQYTLTQNAPI